MAWSEERAREMIARYEAGEGARALGMAYGKSMSSIQWQLKKAGVETRTRQESRAILNARPSVRLMICRNCGNTSKIVKGLCRNCYEWKRKTGSNRPATLLNLRGHIGPGNPSWKGDAAGEHTKRKRAHRTRPVLGACEDCGAQAVDRHHRDGNVGNNHVSNIASLCRRCHMAVDGRLEVFTSHSRSRSAS